MFAKPISTLSLVPLNPDFGGRLFVTSNPSKIQEFTDALGYGIAATLITEQLPPTEPSNALFKQMANGEYQAAAEAVAAEKITYVCSLLKTTNIFIENVLFFLPSLGGYPGPFTQELIDESDGLNVLAKQVKAAIKDPNAVAEATAISTIAVLHPEFGVQFRHGTARGLFSLCSKGENGFGWDSRFRITACGLKGPLPTYAELSPAIKSKVSMRANAINLTKAFPFL